MTRSSTKLNFGIFGIILMLISIAFIPKAEAKQKHPLVGVWKMEYQKEGRTVVCYKLLNKNGTYVNLKSLDKNGECFYVSRHGKFAPEEGKYTEFLMEEEGERYFPPFPFPLEYRFLDKKTVEISFYLDNQPHQEIWYKVKKAPKY